MSKCPYANVFGEPGKGVHSWRVFDLPVVDVVGTLGLAWATARWSGAPFWWNLLAWLYVAEVSHWVAGTQTAFWRWLGIDPCEQRLYDVVLFGIRLGFSWIHLGMALFYVFCILFIDDARTLFAVALGIYVTLALLRAMGHCVLTDLENPGMSLSDIVASLVRGDVKAATPVVEELIVLFGLLLAFIKILALSFMRTVYGVAYSCTWK